MLHGPSLIPSASVSKLVRNDTNTVQIRVIEIDLVDGISPSITNSHSFKVDLSLIQESVIVKNLIGKGWNIMSSEGLSSYVQWTRFQSWPWPVKVIEEIEQMISCYSCWRNKWLSCISVVRKSDSDGLIDKDCMAQNVPRWHTLKCFIFSDSNRSYLSESSKLRACTWPTLQPYDQRDSRIRHSNAVWVGPKKAVIHSRLSFGIMPINLLISLMMKVVPE